LQDCCNAGHPGHLRAGQSEAPRAVVRSGNEHRGAHPAWRPAPPVRSSDGRHGATDRSLAAARRGAGLRSEGHRGTPTNRAAPAGLVPPRPPTSCARPLPTRSGAHDDQVDALARTFAELDAPIYDTSLCWASGDDAAAAADPMRRLEAQMNAIRRWLWNRTKSNAALRYASDAWLRASARGLGGAVGGRSCQRSLSS
jgi:hypothetical protein